MQESNNFTPCQETVEHISSWCDDAAANRIKNLAEQIRDELRGVHSDFRRENMYKMSNRIISSAKPKKVHV